MFERLGEIYANNERYNCAHDETDHDELPAIFWWFPKQEDFIPPPPTDETCLEKMERISSTIKLSRNEITEILYSDISPEEKIIRTMEIIREADHIKQLFKECEADPEAKKKDVGELLAKCRAGLVDYQANVNSLDISKFAMDMKNENEFMNGLQQQLVPWMDEGEKVTGVTLEKPKSFEQARETEKQSVFFAKDVRKANKLLAKVEEAAKRLARYQTTAEGQIEEQRMRFKKIASVAASRVESMRDLLIRWEEMNNSVEKDALDFQPLTQFLKCYAIYFSSS
eukprot:GFUD01011098.1.p1 GENE.GFUD01011098.1~~GFUD01011098.1.p1  ORF type:complete len:283 (+),score=118.73 GFUD01011098.1:147-995(+)